ncbi:MAG: glycosyltransferase family 39 protein [Elusimicrobiaceae bacterium]|nr:glycosyltransferase family 39 protein [Elusimicrobiaceae bacterium]
MQKVISFFIDKRNLKYFIFAAFVILYFWNIGGYGLMNPDEGRYAEIPREMLESGDYFTPRLNQVLYFEKPPLYYWFTAASFAIFGQNEFGARFTSVVMGLLSILLTWFVARKFEGEDTANLSALILGTSGLFFALSRVNIIDMTLSALLTLALFSFYIFYKENKKRWLYIFYVALALATLAKGLIGIVLPGGVIFFFMLFTRDWKILKRLFLTPAILIFFLICVPPFYMVCKKNPDFFYFFFIQEHFLRYATKMHDRYQPFWFFIPVIIGGLFPWTAGLFTNIKNYLNKQQINLYLILWIVIITLFFSASSSKLIPYILPVFPPLAILIAKNILSLTESGQELTIKIWLWVFTLVTVVLIVASVLIFNGFIPLKRINEAMLYKTPFILLCIVCAVFCIIFWAIRKQSKKFLIAHIVFAFCFLAASLPVFGILGEQRSTKTLSKMLMPLLQPQDIVLHFNTYKQDMPFYTKHRIAIYNREGELSFGRSKAEDADNWFIDSESIENFLNQPLQDNQKLYIIVKDKHVNLMPGIENFEYIGHDKRELNLYVRK